MPKCCKPTTHKVFIFCLAKYLTPNIVCVEHNYASVEQCGNILPEECKDHDYYRKTNKKLFRNGQIYPKYADYISWATKQSITYIKETTPSTLAKRNLVINESKTEEYDIIRQVNEKWKKCKLLGRHGKGHQPQTPKDNHSAHGWN